MKKLLVKIILLFNKKFFDKMSYEILDRWGIEDIHEDKIIFKN
jgi:hypothetical protein